MVEFNIEEYFLREPPKRCSLSVKISDKALELRNFFVERRVSSYKLVKILGCQPSGLSSWFNGKLPMPAKWQAKLEALKNMFIEWEKVHGYMFNSEEHLLIVNKPKPPPPTPKKVPVELPKFASVPLHDCPYKKDGLNFGLDYNEYDVCDDCYLSVACLRYKKRYESKRKF
jgi:hypothetical protein